MSAVSLITKELQIDNIGDRIQQVDKRAHQMFPQSRPTHPSLRENQASLEGNQLLSCLDWNEHGDSF